MKFLFYFFFLATIVASTLAEKQDFEKELQDALKKCCDEFSVDPTEPPKPSSSTEPPQPSTSTEPEVEPQLSRLTADNNATYNNTGDDHRRHDGVPCDPRNGGPPCNPPHWGPPPCGPPPSGPPPSGPPPSGPPPPYGPPPFGPPPFGPPPFGPPPFGPPCGHHRHGHHHHKDEAKLALCALTKMGLMSESGHVEVAVIKTKLQDIVKTAEELDHLVNDCIKEAATPEETAYRIMKCFKYVLGRHHHHSHHHRHH